MTTEQHLKVLSIDAWADGNSGWTWNSWFHVGNIDQKQFDELNTTRKILSWFRSKGFLTEASKGRVSVQDDGYNLVVVDRSNRSMPMFAIEYAGAD